MTNACNTLNVANLSQIIGRGKIDRLRLGFCPRQRVFDVLGRQNAAAKRGSLCGIEPLHVQIQKGAGIDERLVSIPRRYNQGAFLCCSIYGYKGKHGFDGKGRALGGIEAVGGPEQGGGVVLTLGNDAVGRIEHVGTHDLGDVQRLTSKEGLSFVSRHVKSRDVSVFIAFYKVEDGSLHSSSASTTCIITAHSMRFLKSSHPYS